MSDSKRENKTSVHKGTFEFTRIPEDPRERQRSYKTQFVGQLLHESWLPADGPITHAGATGLTSLSLECVGGFVSAPADVVRCLRALADHLDSAVSPRYPLYCVDLGERGSDECQYYGPYTTHDVALDARDEDTDIVRRCRRVLPSEIRYNVSEVAQGMKDGDLRDPLDWLVEELDDAAQTGELPDHAWYYVGDQIVHGKAEVVHGDCTLPTAENFTQWIDEHLQVEAYICEGDE